MNALEVVVIVVLAGCPWIVGIAYYWRKQVKDGSVPQSFGEQLRQRMTFR